MIHSEQEIYCSLDIETSGFDPEKNEILEVGFVFFVIEKNGLKITEEWTRVFKPAGEVPVAILGLTGITKEELGSANPFSEFAQELQEKLGDAVIVGHNVGFDIKFLEKAGIRFSGKVLDTLDLVQIILPTHHSYNLENLMHLFSVSHKNAHRALADSKAALVVLEKLLRVFQSFPEEVREKVIDISNHHGFFWAPLMKQRIVPMQMPKSADSRQQTAPALDCAYEARRIYNFPLGRECSADLIRAFESAKELGLLVVPHISEVFELWQRGLCVPAFSEENLFDEKKFAKLLVKKNLTPEQAKFAMKILVWSKTNWQTETMLDLNLSFFGGQFRTLISGRKLKEQKTSAVVCSDMKTFSDLSEKKLYAKRSLVITGLNEFEQYVSSGTATKLGWGYMLYLLKSFYNPEIQSGNLAVKEIVEQALIATDLFFGLVQALLRDETSPFQYVKIDEGVLHSENFGKIRAAAENYAKNLQDFADPLGSKEIADFAARLLAYFEDSENQVKWIELAETRCVFFSSPLEIDHLVTALLSPYKKVSFADALGSQKILAYFIERLGLSEFGLKEIGAVHEGDNQKKVQGDLFHSLLSLGKEVLGSTQKAKRVNCRLLNAIPASDDLVQLVGKNNLPAAILLPTPAQIKQFYDERYQELQNYAFLLNQSTSGGSNKLFHNFSIHKNSLLIGSGKLILKNLQASSGLSPVKRLEVKTLVLCHLPFEQFTHPYQEALASRFSNAFEEFSLPRAVYNLHCLLQFFNTDQLENLYICDAKLSKGYASAFKDYVAQLPGVHIVQNG